LGELLFREYPAFYNLEVMPVDQEHYFDEIIRTTTGAYLTHVSAKGILLQRLMAEPSILAAVHDRHSIGREAAVRSFAAQFAADYKAPIDLGTRVADILMGATGAAGSLLFHEKLDCDELCDLVVRMILAGVRAAVLDEGDSPRTTRGRKARSSIAR
jgi:hypothetical protein